MFPMREIGGGSRVRKIMNISRVQTESSNVHKNDALMSQTKNNFIRVHRPSFSSLEARAEESIQKKEKAETIYFYLTAQLLRKKRIWPRFSLPYLPGHINPFSEPWPPRGFSPFFFSNRAQASKHSGTKTSSGFPPLADQ